MCTCLCCRVILHRLVALSDLQRKEPFHQQIIWSPHYEAAQKPTSTSCGKEWTNKGTCCEQSSLNLYSVKDKTTIIESASRINQKFSNYIRWFSTLNSTLYQIGALANFNWKATGLVSPPLVPRVDEFISKLNNMWLKRPAFFGYGIEHVDTVFSAANSRCWNKLANLRSSALCSTCSDSSQSFFFDSKANMDQQSCDLVFNDCWQAFKILQIWIERMAISGVLKDWVALFGSEIIRISNPGFFDLEKVRRIFKAMEENSFGHVGVLFEEYDPFKTHTTEDEKKLSAIIRRELCRKFVKLVGHSIIEILDSAISLDQSQVSLGSVTEALVARHRATTGAAYSRQFNRMYSKFDVAKKARVQHKLSVVTNLLNTLEQENSDRIKQAISNLPNTNQESPSPKKKGGKKKGKKLLKLGKLASRNLNLELGTSGEQFFFDFKEQVNVFSKSWTENLISTSTCIQPMNLSLNFP